MACARYARWPSLQRRSLMTVSSPARQQPEKCSCEAARSLRVLPVHFAANSAGPPGRVYGETVAAVRIGSGGASEGM